MNSTDTIAHLRLLLAERDAAARLVHEHRLGGWGDFTDRLARAQMALDRGAVTALPALLELAERGLACVNEECPGWDDHGQKEGQSDIRI